MGVLKELLENARKWRVQILPAWRVGIFAMAIIGGILVTLSALSKSPNIPLNNFKVTLTSFETVREILSKGGISQIDYDQKAQMILVPEPERAQALILLVKAQLLPPDSFKRAIKEIKSTDSKEKIALRFLVALQDEVNRMLENIEGIELARVIYASSPIKCTHCHTSKQRQRAVVAITMAANYQLTQELADTIIKLVAFAKSGLNECDVQVTDQNNHHFKKDTEINDKAISVSAIIAEANN